MGIYQLRLATIRVTVLLHCPPRDEIDLCSVFPAERSDQPNLYVLLNRFTTRLNTKSFPCFFIHAKLVATLDQ